jgi:hypothetical protein
VTDSLEESLRDLAREGGRALADLGVRPEDEKWIREHADTIASLAGRRRRRLAGLFYRLARWAARKAS